MGKQEERESKEYGGPGMLIVEGVKSVFGGKCGTGAETCLTCQTEITTCLYCLPPFPCPRSGEIIHGKTLHSCKEHCTK